MISCDSGGLLKSLVARSFYRGNYSDVLSLLGRAPLFTKKNKEDWPYQIAAMVFTGETLEAFSLFSLALKQKKLSEESLVQARFFIGVGLVRISRYADARKEFAINLNTIRRTRKTKKNYSTMAFYAFQGAAFYRFFKAQYKDSRKLAKKAYQSAFEDGMLFGQAFALELMGHCNCQLGEVHRGIQDFNKAILCTEKIGNGGLNSAFLIAREKFKAQYGIDFKNVVQNLSKAIRTLKPEDTYSKTELYLELTRQLILRGKVTEAKALLDEHAETVYRHQNRRQSALFNLRYSHILYLQGESSAALTLLRSSKVSLVPDVDLFYLKQFIGLESKILSEQYSKNDVNNLISQRFVSFVDERIYSRAMRDHKFFIKTGEDFVGDLIDAAHHMHIDISELLKTGLFSLIPPALKQKSACSFILLGPTRGELVIHSKGDVLWVHAGMTQPLIKILLLLEGGVVLTKEKLVQEVWGYEYRSDRHDSLLHASIGKLRKLLGKFAVWVEWTSGGYRLHSDIKIIRHTTAHMLRDVSPLARKAVSVNSEILLETSNVHVAPTSELNHRQIKLIKKLENGSFVGVSDYSREYQVCKMTACRDLTILWKKNILLKHGRARATQYRLRGVRNENE